MMENDFLQPSDHSEKITTADILRRIDQVMADTAHLRDCVEAVKQLPSTTNSPDTPGQALGEIVIARETTHQQALRLLEKMYDDLVSPRVPPDPAVQKIAGIARAFEHLPPDVAENLIEKAMEELF